MYLLSAISHLGWGALSLNIIVMKGVWREKMELLSKKLSMTLILLLLVVSGSLVYAFTLLQVTVPSSITITTTGDLFVTDLDGAVLSALDFGSVAPGGTVSKTIQIVNLSNGELGIYVQCFDIVGMTLTVSNGDGSEWVNMAPLSAGRSIAVMLTITAPTDAPAGTHTFNLVFSGEG